MTKMAQQEDQRTLRMCVCSVPQLSQTWQRVAGEEARGWMAPVLRGRDCGWQPLPPGTASCSGIHTIWWTMSTCMVVEGEIVEKMEKMEKRCEGERIHIWGRIKNLPLEWSAGWITEFQIRRIWDLALFGKQYSHYSAAEMPISSAIWGKIAEMPFLALQLNSGAQIGAKGSNWAKQH